MFIIESQSSESCENCIRKNECESHNIFKAVWCMYWPEYNNNDSMKNLDTMKEEG